MPTVKYVTSLGKVHQSHRKFAPKRTNKAKKKFTRGQNRTIENPHNKASNVKGVWLHNCKALLTPTGENKGGYWLWQPGRTYKPPSHVGARTARTKFAPQWDCENSHQ